MVGASGTVKLSAENHGCKMNLSEHVCLVTPLTMGIANELGENCGMSRGKHQYRVGTIYKGQYGHVFKLIGGKRETVADSVVF